MASDGQAGGFDPDFYAHQRDKAQFTNRIRRVPSDTYYARLRVKGKLIRKSLKTDLVSSAKLRLTEHPVAEVNGGYAPRFALGPEVRGQFLWPRISSWTLSRENVTRDLVCVWLGKRRFFRQIYHDGLA